MLRLRRHPLPDPVPAIDRGRTTVSRFAGKTAVVTGASRGIGAAIAHRFAAEGAAVLLSANEPGVETVAAAIREKGGKAASFVGDVTDKTSVVAMFDEAEK